MRRLYGWIPLLATVLLPAMLLAQLPVTGVIGGEVHISGGDFPPHQILVELSFRGSTIYSAYADGQGHFAFSNLAPNSYIVVIRDDAYYPVDDRVDIRPEAPYVNVQISLRPREQSKKTDPLNTRALGGNPYLVDPADYNKRFPKKALKEYERGLDAERQSKRDEAIAHYIGALRIAPDYYPAHNNLGALYLGESDFKLAEEQFRQALLLDQNEAQAYFNLSNVLMLTERLPEAETTLVAGLQRRPDSAFGNFLQGCLYVRMGKFAEAESSLQNALRLDSKMPQAYLQLVNLYLRQNRREDAITQLQAFLKGFPTAPASPKAQEILNKLQKEESTEKR